MLTDVLQWFLLMFPWLVPMLDGITSYQGWLFFALGVWGLHIAARRSAALEQRNETDAKRRNDERYAKCVELLGMGNLATILGAVHGLRHLAREGEGYRDEVVETFCAYVRDGEGEQKIVSAMLHALGNISGVIQINLTDGVFRKMRVGAANLKRADFSRASFVDFVAEGTHLSLSIFQGCTLENVVFEDVELQGSFFKGGQMQAVRIVYSDMSDAIIDGVDMKGVTLGIVNFRRASFRNIRLSSESWNGMDFRDAEFVDCKFVSVYFHGSRFEGCDMAGAEFHGCDFTGCSFHMVQNLTYGQLASAKSLRNAQGLPPGLEERLRREKPELFGEPPR